MPKKEQASSRKPVKARGALPAPVVAPKRVELPWYKRRNVQLGIAFAVVFLGVLAFNVIKDLREGNREERLQIRSIEQFERSLQLLNAPLESVYQSLQTGTDQFVAGTLPAADYRTQAEGWVGEFRKLHTGIKETEVREGFDELLEVKALFAQGAVVLVDGTKAYLQAAALAGPERDASIALGRNLLTHGGAIIGMAERRMQTVKNEYGLNDPPAELPEPVVPEEEAPPPAPVVPETGLTLDPAASPPAPASPEATPASPAAPPASPASTAVPAPSP